MCFFFFQTIFQKSYRRRGGATDAVAYGGCGPMIYG